MLSFALLAFALAKKSCYRNVPSGASTDLQHVPWLHLFHKAYDCFWLSSVTTALPFSRPSPYCVSVKGPFQDQLGRQASMLGGALDPRLNR